jgi:hypothetical protein
MTIAKNFEGMQELMDSHINTLQTALVNLSIEFQELKREVKLLKERASIHNLKISEIEGMVFPFGE